MDNHLSIRRAAAQALQRLVVRIPLDRLTIVSDALLVVTADDMSRGATISVAAKSVGKLVACNHNHIPPHRQVQIVTQLLRLAATTPAPLNHEAFLAGMTIAINARGMSRDVATDYLRKHESDPLAVAYLAALDVSLAQEQIQSTVNGLLAGIGASAVPSGDEIKITYGPYIPRVFENLQSQLSPQQMRYVVAGLIQGIDNEHDTLGSRGQMLYVLGQLADRMPTKLIPACADLCQRVIQRGISLSTHLTAMQEMTDNAFSNFRVFSGTRADVLGGAAWALAHLCEQLHSERRSMALNSLRQLAKDPDVDVRRRVAGSLSALRGLRQKEHQQLILPLIVLLHDADDTVRGLAVRSAADLYHHNAIASSVDVLQRILELGLNDPALTVRTAVAYALRNLTFDTMPTLTTFEGKVRNKLQADPSFQVRSGLANR